MPFWRPNFFSRDIYLKTSYVLFFSILSLSTTFSNLHSYVCFLLDITRPLDPQFSRVLSMTSFYLSPPSPCPQIEGNQGQDHLLFTLTSQTFSPPSAIYFRRKYELGDYDEDHQEQPQHLHQHEADIRFSAGGSVDQNQLASSLPTVADQNYSSSRIKPSSICKRDDLLLGNPCDNAPINSPTKWMSSKMRIMRKMMSSDRTVTDKLSRVSQTSPDDQNNSTNTVIRVCSDCNTTKTPLWRSGPKGPKSLCNACGIRQRKARRALAAASAAASGGVDTTDPVINSGAPKQKRSEGDCTIQYKKQCKLAGSKKQLQFDNFMLSLSENSSFHRVFPQDERDAAILLMALSCGLAYS